MAIHAPPFVDDDEEPWQPMPGEAVHPVLHPERAASTVAQPAYDAPPQEWIVDQPAQGEQAALDDEDEEERTHRRADQVNWSRLVRCLIGLGALTPFWIFGARYTIDGVVQYVNEGLGFLRLGVEVPYPFPGWWYLPLFIIPLGCSKVEWGDAPWYLWVKAQRGKKVQRRKKGERSRLERTVVWVIVAAFDFITTLVGINSAPASAGPVALWLAKNSSAGGTAAFLLTFGPEWGMRAMWTGVREETGKLRKQVTRQVFAVLHGE